MSTVTVYTFKDRNDSEQSFSTMDLAKARAHAAEHKFQLIANDYEWTESEPLDDFRETNMSDERWKALLTKTGDLMASGGLNLIEAAEQAVEEVDGTSEDVCNLVDYIGEAEDTARENDRYEAEYR